MLRLTKIVNALETAKSRILVKLAESEDTYESEELDEELYAIEEALYILKEYE